MLAMERKQVDFIHDISYYAKDSRLTGEPDGKRYKWREMIDRFRQLGRPLTDEEAEEFRIKQLWHTQNMYEYMIAQLLACFNKRREGNAQGKKSFAGAFLFAFCIMVDFNTINNTSNLNWTFKSQIKKFIIRFFKNPYREEDTKWIKKLASENNVNIKLKLAELNNQSAIDD